MHLGDDFIHYTDDDEPSNSGSLFRALIVLCREALTIVSISDPTGLSPMCDERKR